MTHISSNPRVRGLLIALMGIVVLSPDAMLVRVIRAQGWDLLFWRGLLEGLTLSVGLIVWYRGNFINELRRCGGQGVWSALVLTAVAISFVMALRFTSAANVLIIVAASPLISGLLARLWYGEQTPAATWLAMIAAGVGVTIVVYDGIQRTELLGEGFAFCCSAGHALNFCILRKARSINATFPLAASAFLVAMVAVLARADAHIGFFDVGWIAVLGVVVLPLSFSLLLLAPRYIAAPEVGLVMLLEVLLGPSWVWLAVSERPSTSTVIGGSVVAVAVVAQCIYAIRRGTPVPRGVHAHIGAESATRRLVG
jgi:drug/metabolite transporter (DMT)-like permease